MQLRTSNHRKTFNSKANPSSCSSHIYMFLARRPINRHHSKLSCAPVYTLQQPSLFLSLSSIPTYIRACRCCCCCCRLYFLSLTHKRLRQQRARTHRAPFYRRRIYTRRRASELLARTSLFLSLSLLSRRRAIVNQSFLYTRFRDKNPSGRGREGAREEGVIGSTPRCRGSRLPIYLRR